MSRGVAFDLPHGAAGRGNHDHLVAILRVVGGEPGLSNRGVALRVGVSDEGGISRLLGRLARLGLIQSTQDPRGRGGANAWRLTARGGELERALGGEPVAPGSSVVFDLPGVPGGRLDHEALSVLRVIGEQPWLSNREVALRAGVGDPGHVARLLSALAGLGLVASTRDTRRRGAPNAWQLTARGQQLDRALGRERTARQRSVALDLMQQSGGRLSDRAVSVLMAIGSESGLSNRELAVRVGVSAQSRLSQLLARLAGRGLIENTRSAGRENRWQLTASGSELETAIRRETRASQ